MRFDCKVCIDVSCLVFCDVLVRSVHLLTSDRQARKALFSKLSKARAEALGSDGFDKKEKVHRKKKEKSDVAPGSVPKRRRKRAAIPEGTSAEAGANASASNAASASDPAAVAGEIVD